MFLYSSVSLNNKTAGLGSRNVSDLNSACSKVLLGPIKNFGSQTCNTKLNDIGALHTAYIELVYIACTGGLTYGYPNRTKDQNSLKIWINFNTLGNIRGFFYARV